jgi:circadian clock protein KaiB
MPEPPSDSFEKFEKALQDQKHQKYVLKLFIAGNTSKSAAAIDSLRHICETELAGRYELEVVDIYQQPELVRGQQIIAAPTLIKQLPLPLRRMVGDLTRRERILVGLDLQPTQDGSDPDRGGQDD